MCVVESGGELAWFCSFIGCVFLATRSPATDKTHSFEFRFICVCVYVSFLEAGLPPCSCRPGGSSGNFASGGVLCVCTCVFNSRLASVFYGTGNIRTLLLSGGNGVELCCVGRVVCVGVGVCTVDHCCTLFHRSGPWRREDGAPEGVQWRQGVDAPHLYSAADVSHCLQRCGLFTTGAR